MTSLWEALGRPPLEAPLPGPRAIGWRMALVALTHCLLERGVRVRFRSAGVLWCAFAGSLPRPGANWRQLCDLGSVDTLVGALVLGEVADGIRFATWNVSWLLCPPHG